MSLLERTETGEWPAIIVPDGPKAVARRLLAETAAKHCVAVADVISDSRFKSLVAARREAAWLIAKDTTMSFLQIAAMLRKDHTSIINAIRCVNDQTGTNVRSLGGVPAAKKERDLRSARRVVVVAQLKDEARVMELWRGGFDTVQIAKALGWRLPRAANALARARDRERASQ
jgi:hypothetical protein